MKGILSRDFLALILSVAVVGLGLGATLPLTALALDAGGLRHRHRRADDGDAGGRRPRRRAVREPRRRALRCARDDRRHGDRRGALDHRDAVHRRSVAVGGAALSVRRGADAALHDRRGVGHATRRRFDARPRRRDLRDQLHSLPDDGSGARQRDRRTAVDALRDLRRDFSAGVARARVDTRCAAVAGFAATTANMATGGRCCRACRRS